MAITTGGGGGGGGGGGRGGSEESPPVKFDIIDPILNWYDLGNAMAHLEFELGGW